MNQAKILVVEDRTDWQAIVCETIADMGHSPYPVASYDEAVAALTAQHFDLAIIDPVLDRANPFNRAGVSVIQKISESKPLPIIVVTGSFTPDIKASLTAICPDAPVCFKESWNPTEFTHFIDRELTDSQAGGGHQASRQAQTEPRSPRRLTPPGLEKSDGRPRILVIENRPDWQEIITEILDDQGYFWRVAPNAQAALAEMDRENFHLALLDLKLQTNELPMNSSEGWLLLDHLVEAFPKTKILIVSGRASPADVAQLLTKYPIIGFVEKQRFAREKIIEAVEEATQAPELRIQTFGQFRLWRDGVAITNWERPQAELLIKMLLTRRATGERAISSEELITRMWPESDEMSGRKKLRPLISNARHTIEPDIEPRDSNFIIRTSTGYFFDLTRQVHWDLDAFREAHQQGNGLFQAEQWAAAIDAYEQGTALYKGDFLAEDRYADWAISLRHELATDFRDLQVALADCYAALGHYPQAIAACERALRKDPLLESVYRRLMRLHVCNQEKGLALKVYRDCVKLFEELFEESPTPATRQLHDDIANDRPVPCLAE